MFEFSFCKKIEFWFKIDGKESKTKTKNCLKMRISFLYWLNLAIAFAFI